MPLRESYPNQDLASVAAAFTQPRDDKVRVAKPRLATKLRAR